MKPRESKRVLLPYRFTLFSNPITNLDRPRAVLLPYRFTLFSNAGTGNTDFSQFYYLIDLHYSQTTTLECSAVTLFYYLIDLHYSQTSNRE